jgi:hypothetical protein
MHPRKHFSWRKYHLYCLIAGSLTVVCSPLPGQDRGPDYVPTPNTVKGATPDPKKQGEKQKKLRYIITNNTRNTLSGNPCFEDATTDMGFQYLAIPRGQAPNTNNWSRWWHNLGVKFVILMKNGPCWKAKVNRLYKDCRHQTGDFVG